MALAYVSHANLPPDECPSGPDQKGAGKKGQYVYWITWPHPVDASIQVASLKCPDSMTRNEFSTVIVDVHKACDIDVLEVAVFLEPHANGKVHLN